MNIFQRVRSFFSSKDKNEETLPPVEVAQAVESKAEEMIETAVENFKFGSQISDEQEESLPYWLSNEDALKDEGVIFGLSNANPDEKINIINSFFIHQTAELEKNKEQLYERISELNLSIEQNQTKIEEFKGKMDQLENKAMVDHNLARTVAGLVLSLGMCIGNYFLISRNIQVGFPENYQWISVGVFLAGMFNLYNPTSVFHSKDSGMTWKSALEEFGIPLAASFFVFVQVYESQPLLKSLALFGFIFFLFLFSGKILLGNITVLKADISKWLSNRNTKNDQNSKVEYWDSQIKSLHDQIDQLRVEKWKIIPDLNKTEARLEKYKAKRDSLIHVFQSEFLLARGYKANLNPAQIKKILE
ncbi:hypothetical protein GVN16_12455 [Emticicia sp. CRIBPO]|uniref:hypothetical protein n=1 Tax=Emticicia sp. CRIBPO TaxID=2683258 RepID=UPI00141345F6|nr:hypothetical protein [Emticicia sp. CRIBPO]NBA86580.1 hypothetical protein [Emticicia sp. CRIBPO]